MMKNTRLHFLYISLFFVVSCNKDQRQGEKSLEGTWRVTAIETNYGDFGNSMNIDSSFHETGDLGSFQFGEDKVEYTITQRGEMRQGENSWKLEAIKENEGFIKVTKFYLLMDDTFLFDVQFDDATKNAEKNAATAIFAEDPDSVTDEQLILWLEKE